MDRDRSGRAADTMLPARIVHLATTTESRQCYSAPLFFEHPAFNREAEMEGIDRIKLFELHAKKIEGENNLVNQRMSWFISLNSFLFAAAALSIKAAGDTTEQNLEVFASNFVGILSLVGVAISITTIVSVWAAQTSLKAARYSYHEIVARSPESEPLPLPALTGRGDASGASRLGNITAMVLPFAMIFAWLSVRALTP
ncbi:hypothetical protein [Cereibacter sphaeroides]|uniref:hypothetical protein n=1 Tax=Cereibacter sphaeroides TaxID=1063 RepID=UPI00140FAAD0|nr:hypothetical protein [Cereibacter sphaeroides]